MLHGSNVCGTLMPAEEMGAFCRRHGLVFILDTAQTAGTFPIDMEAMHIDALAFTGHKGLLGPQGIGGFLLRPELAGRIEPLLSGGTGCGTFQSCGPWGGTAWRDAPPWCPWPARAWTPPFWRMRWDGSTVC